MLLFHILFYGSLSILFYNYIYFAISKSNYQESAQRLHRYSLLQSL